LAVQGVERMVWVDCHGYDGWPALAFLEAAWPLIPSFLLDDGTLMEH